MYLTFSQYLRKTSLFYQVQQVYIYWENLFKIEEGTHSSAIITSYYSINLFFLSLFPLAIVGPPQTPASEVEPAVNETILSNQPPPPPPPKEILKTMDYTPYIR